MTCNIFFSLSIFFPNYMRVIVYFFSPPCCSRYILVDWLVEVTTMKDFSSLALHVTVGCVDRYLALRSVPKARLQLLGIACMVVCTRWGGLQIRIFSVVFFLCSLYSITLIVEHVVLESWTQPYSLKIIGLIWYVFFYRYISKEILTIREAVWLTDNTYKYEDLVRMMGEVVSVLEGKIRVSKHIYKDCTNSRSTSFIWRLINLFFFALCSRAPLCQIMGRCCSRCSPWRGDPLTCSATSVSCRCSTPLSPRHLLPNWPARRFSLHGHCITMVHTDAHITPRKSLFEFTIWVLCTGKFIFILSYVCRSRLACLVMWLHRLFQAGPGSAFGSALCQVVSSSL